MPRRLEGLHGHIELDLLEWRLVINYPCLLTRVHEHRFIFYFDYALFLIFRVPCSVMLWFSFAFWKAITDKLSRLPEAFHLVVGLGVVLGRSIGRRHLTLVKCPELLLCLVVHILLSFELTVARVLLARWPHSVWPVRRAVLLQSWHVGTINTECELVPFLRLALNRWLLPGGSSFDLNLHGQFLFKILLSLLLHASVVD